MIAEWHNPYLFALCIVLYICVYYMGYHGKTWYLRKNNKKVKKNRTLL